MKGCAALVPGIVLASLAWGCGADDGGPPAWDPQVGGSGGASTGPGGDDTPGSEGAGGTADSDATGGSGSCTPGQRFECSCADGSPGYHVCNASGDAVSPCTCEEEGSTGEAEGSSGEEPPPAGPQVCYPGQNNDFTTCLPLHEFAPLPAGYDYPPPYQGNPNYRSPVALLDLQEVDPGTWLAPNFQLGEIAQPDKGRYAVVQPHAVVSLQALRDQVGALGVNSGYRSPAYNAGIPGSATYSRHMYGDAYDLDPLEVSLGTLENACTANGGMLVQYNTHVHCDFRFDPVDEEFYGAPMGDDEVERPSFAATVERGDDGVWRAPAEGFDEGEPLRRWTAYDAAGQVLATAVGAEFIAPEGAVSVHVNVGAQVERSMAVP